MNRSEWQEYVQMKSELAAWRKISADKEAVIADLHDQLNQMEERAQFWCDEARKLGYRE